MYCCSLESWVAIIVQIWGYNAIIDTCLVLSCAEETEDDIITLNDLIGFGILDLKKYF